MKRTILPICLAFCSPVFAVGSTTEYLFHSSTNDLFKNIQEPEPNHNATLDPQESKPTVNEELSPKEKFELAMTTLNQNGNFNQDKVKILNLLTESASGGYGDAQLVLGKNYLHGALSDKDEKSAFAWLSLAAEKNSDAQVYFKEKVLDNHWTEYEWLWDAKQFTKNLCKKLSLPIPKFILDEEARFNEASSKSVNGDPEATFDLADFYETGKGVRPNSEKGVELIRTAAIKGSTRAHYRVACSFYLIGNPYKFKKNDKLDPQGYILWLKKAASRGYDKAELDLGRAYLKGLGLTPVEVEYLDGKPIAPDISEAKKWFLLAKQHGNLDASIELSTIERADKAKLKKSNDLIYYNSLASTLGTTVSNLEAVSKLDRFFDITMNTFIVKIKTAASANLPYRYNAIEIQQLQNMKRIINEYKARGIK